MAANRSRNDAIAASAGRGGLALTNHHFSGLDDNIHGVAFLKLQLLRAGTGNKTLDGMIADLDEHMCHHIA